MSNEASDLIPSSFNPNPTSEAKAYEWNSLCPSTRNALDKLIRWLDAACAANELSKSNEQEILASKYESPSTSILVSGDRGSGKTTVLLSAAYAFKLTAEQKGDFFPAIGNNYTELRTKLRNICKKVYWLNILDLEPLHPNSNLLAAMLVRIRSAIESIDDENTGSDGSDYRSRRRSILEGDLGTGEHLNRLINNATFMWEALPGGPDPRLERSEQQIKAAEISADFQHEFKSVMEKTTSLVKNRGLQTELFILPIDNVDRSIDHIAGISKLIRLAASRRLWFILAAVRPDYQLFLERSFQNELLRSGTGSNTSDWDQTQAIARRQAATSVRRSLPENYQIRIEPLTHEHSWTFPNVKIEQPETHDKDKQHPSGITVKFENFSDLCKLVESCKVNDTGVKFEDSASGTSVKLENIPVLCKTSLMKSDKERELKDLLGDIHFYLPEEKKTRFQTLADLFEITGQLDNARKAYLEATTPMRKDKKLDENQHVFTGAGKMALGLSMRTLLDLKAAIALHPKDIEDAIEVSVRMLRNAIDESDLPFWASQQLMNRIIRKDSNNKWVLDLTNNPIKRFSQPPRFHEVPYPTDPWEKEDTFVIEEKLSYKEYPDIVLELHNVSTKGKSYPLPPVIAGWFMILHDILVLSRKPWVISPASLPHEIFPAVVRNNHKLIYKNRKSIELQFEWGIPQWPTFAEHFLFAVQWTAVLHRLKNHFAKKDAKEVDRILHLAWIDNICSVSGENGNDWKANKELITLKELFTLNYVSQTKEIKKKIENEINSVICKVCKLVSWSREDKFDDRKTVTWKWLSQELPLLLCPEYSLLMKHNYEPRYKTNLIWPKDLLSDKELGKIEWPEKEKEQPQKFCNDLKDEWKKNFVGLKASREEIVRSAIENSPDFKTWAQSCSKEGNPIEKIMEDWFSVTGILRDSFSPKNKRNSRDPLDLLIINLKKE